MKANSPTCRNSNRSSSSLTLENLTMEQLEKVVADYKQKLANNHTHEQYPLAYPEATSHRATLQVNNLGYLKCSPHNPKRHHKRKSKLYTYIPNYCRRGRPLLTTKSKAKSTVSTPRK
jgi:hypothetical protein